MRSNNYWFDVSDAITKEAITLRTLYLDGLNGATLIPDVRAVLEFGIWGLNEMGDLVALVPNDLEGVFNHYDEMGKSEERLLAATASAFVKRMFKLLRGNENLSPSIESNMPRIEAAIYEVDRATNL